MSCYVSINGALCAPDQARLSIFDHGFLFGDSVYEVVRTWQGRPFGWEPHLDRLFASAAQIALTVPWSRRQLRAEVVALLSASRIEGDAYVRIIITRGVGELSLDPAGCVDPQRIIIAQELTRLLPAAYEKGIRLSLVSTMRNSRFATNPGIKSGNYLNNVLALMEARRNGADEAIMLNEHGHVTECTTSNIFVVRRGCLVTPSLDCGLLAGVTRRFILDLARAQDIPTEETELRASDLQSADELFITSTTRDIVPVAAIDDQLRSDAPGPLTRRLMELFDARRQQLLD